MAKDMQNTQKQKQTPNLNFNKNNLDEVRSVQRDDSEFCIFTACKILDLCFATITNLHCKKWMLKGPPLIPRTYIFSVL